MQIVPTILPGSYPSKVTQPDGYNPSPLPPPSDYYISKKEILDKFLKRNPSVPKDTIPTFDSDGQLKSSSKTIEGLIDEITAKVTDGATEAYDTLKEIEAYITEDKSGTAAIIKALETKATKSELAAKQDKLTAGTNIIITEDGTISASGGGGSSVEVVPPNKEATKGQAADAKAVYEELNGIYDNISDIEAANILFDDKLIAKVDKLTNPPNGVAYPNEVHLENGGFYLLGANESNSCNAYLSIDGSFDPQTFIVYCKNGTSTRFIDQSGRSILTNLNGVSYTGGSVNLRTMGFPTQRFVAVTMRKIKSDKGNEMIHLEIV